jgi:RIO kinase 1
LIRDVDNLASFLGRYAPELRRRQYGREMWDLYTRNQLHPDTRLTGRAPPSRAQAHRNELEALLDELTERTKAKRRETGERPPAWSADELPEDLDALLILGD